MMTSLPQSEDVSRRAMVRGLFPRFGQVAFLNHAAAARIPEPVRLAIAGVADQMAEPEGPDALALADVLRAKIAALINAEAAAVAITRSTAHGISLIAHGLPWQAGDNVVSATGDYPASIYPWMALAGRGVELRLAPAAGGAISPEAVLDLVDSRTRVVCVNHVQFASGYRLDVAAIGAECRRRGVLFCVDVMQSIGAVTVDVQRMQIDVAASGGHKWLLGPSGAAFCYIRPDLLVTIPPLVAGALSVTDKYNFSTYEPQWAPDAHRFEETWLSLPNLAGLSAAVDLATEVGRDLIERAVLARTRELSDALVEAGMSLAAPWPRPAEQTSAIVSFKHPRLPAAQVLAALAAAQVIASQRGEFVRLSPHYYNQDAEIVRALAVITSL